VNQDYVIRLKAISFKKLFEPEDGHKQSAKDFARLIKSNLKNELREANEVLENENKVYELARKIELWDARKVDLDVTLDEAK
jgi:formylmethanofuran dehydrogenase subunit E